MTIGHGVRRFVCRGQVFVAVFCFALAVAITSENATAVDGTWNPTGFSGDGTGLWSDTTKWTGGTIANGAGSSADFSTLNLTLDSIVSLDSSRTIGQLLFGDGNVTAAHTNTWTLNDNLNPLNILTLNNTGGSVHPKITVKNHTTIISAQLAGSAGVILTGGTNVTGDANTSASLVLPTANLYTGGTTINSTAGTGDVFRVCRQ